MAYTPIHLNENELINHLPKSIGQVSLNYDYYSGKDLYSDGQIEDELLAIVKDSSRVEYQGIIEESKNWTFLYHLSQIRGNIVDFLPITKDDKVLEIGSGCGAITTTLASKAKSVTCVDLSAKRSQVNAYRNQDMGNINIMVGNFNDIEPHLDTDYDYVCLIGVFEYGASYIPTDSPYEEFLNIIKKHAKKGGRVIIAIENKFGLKYWAGCKEDHNGEYYSSLEGYPNGGSARTFTRNGLEKIFKACGVSEYHFYYPYPDYKLPHTIFSDKRLPSKGELTDNIRNLDRDRMLTFNESYVYDSIIEDDEFPLFSNSYLAILGPDIDTSYVKYSNDRSLEFAIRTEIISNNNTPVEVRKVALNEMAKEHLSKLSGYADLLTQRYSGSKIRINPCRLSDDGQYATFPFEKGKTLEQILDSYAFSGQIDKFKETFKEYFERISYNSGDVNITDNDLIFANILVDGDDWTVIDYEWSEEKIVDPKKIAFRALYCYVLEDDRRNAVDMGDLLSIIGIATNVANDYIEDELKFQKSVTGNHKAIGEIRATIGTYCMDAKKLTEDALKDIINKRIQIYYNYGEGYSEENSEYCPDVYLNNNRILTSIEFDSAVKELRIDPADDRCIIKINELVLNGNNLLRDKKSILTNGKVVNFGTYVFNTTDPNINIKLNPNLTKHENRLDIDIDITRITEEIASEISNSIRKLF